LHYNFQQADVKARRNLYNQVLLRVEDALDSTREMMKLEFAVRGNSVRGNPVTVSYFFTALWYQVIYESLDVVC